MPPFFYSVRNASTACARKMLALHNKIIAIANSNIEPPLHVLCAGRSKRRRFPVSGMFRRSRKWLRGVRVAGGCDSFDTSERGAMR